MFFNEIRSKITTTAQFSKMVELLEQNPSVARGYSSGVNKANFKEDWNKIGDILNVLGPPTRTGEGWAKVWADYKFKIKKKLIHNKTECRATGGGPFKQFTLSPTEEAAANLLKINTIINPPGRSFGISDINKENESNEAFIPIVDTMQNEGPVCSQSIAPIEPHITNSNAKTTENVESGFSISRMKTPSKKNSKSSLLEEQLNVQTELYKNVSESLNEIKRYLRKNHNLKEEKLKFYKEELKRKKEHRKEMLKLRKEEIEIKKRRMELDELRNINEH